MVVFKTHDSVPSPRYSPVCNVLRRWKTLFIPTYRVYRLYDVYLTVSITHELSCTPHIVLYILYIYIYIYNLLYIHVYLTVSITHELSCTPHIVHMLYSTLRTVPDCQHIFGCLQTGLGPDQPSPSHDHI